MNIRRLNSTDADFSRQLQLLLSGSDKPDAGLIATVETILADVRERGDDALLEYTKRFDHYNATVSDLEIPAATLGKAASGMRDELRQSLEAAAERIQSYHERQKLASWSYKDKDGTTLGQQITPLDRVGVYVPGGKAAYPSSVLMNVIPAKVAGVNEIIMVTPTAHGELNPLVLAAASIAGVDRVFSVGGAQAIAALAYGTETVPKVDKIVGPGNRYVATAKRMVFGSVGIDMIAGPSEVLIICDGKSNPDWVTMDLFAQAEHDEEACAILICPEASFLDAVAGSIKNLLPEMERAGIIQSSLERNGALILAQDMNEAIQLANHIAPEHLELAVEDPERLLPEIRHAGAIFMGRYTAEVLGDYCAGPNHVLPTSRTARFSSPLGVYDFQKRSSVIMCTEKSASKMAALASVLARGEGLTAHARSAEYRIKH
ncbi:MAG: histidinol dehydrogenase [Gammaproteobacteria bacterium]|nr:histidinol dehydrogenase [Gammaproteobacteria bacterium]